MTHVNSADVLRGDLLETQGPLCNCTAALPSHMGWLAGPLAPRPVLGRTRRTWAARARALGRPVAAVLGPLVLTRTPAPPRLHCPLDQASWA